MGGKNKQKEMNNWLQLSHNSLEIVEIALSI